MKRERDKSKQEMQEERMPRKRSPMPPPGYAMNDGRPRRVRAADLADEAAEELPPVGAKPHTLHIQVGSIEATATLNGSATARELWRRLPIRGTANVWGEEVYFEIPLTHPPENPRAQVEAGTIAYWPEGDCFCIFFGQKPYSPVNVLGTLDDAPDLFREIQEGDTIELSRGD